ncbi:MAG: hypothetical protein L0Z50_02480, partial [Verrucomicrobiales bacterium]|nr:hypothetical protein [Verrucomicrobiales bacterium]
DGGSCTLLGNGGQLFTLTFPSNTITTPSFISMTLVTNVAGLPFSRGIIGAVRLQPEKLDIFGAATLDISYPANIDWRQIVSFTCGHDGSDFHLTPDRVRSNYVRIPITHFGTFGSCLATTQEVAQVTQPSFPNADRSQTISKLDLHGAPGRVALQAFLHSSVVCFPERVARAQSVYDELARVRGNSDRKLAEIISRVRQNQLAGVPGDLSDASDLIKGEARIACAVYRDQIDPYWPEAANNCALNGILLMWVLGMQRSQELLGVVGEQGTCTSLQNQPLCPGFRGCLKEIEECCQRNFQGSGPLEDLFALQRQQSLLQLEDGPGFGCLLPEEIKRVQDACTNLSWVGTFTVKEKGETNQTSVSGITTYDETRSYLIKFEGNVIESTEESFGDMGEFGSAVILKVSGNLHARDFRKVIASRSDNCGEYIGVSFEEKEVSTSRIYRVQIIFEPADETYTIYARSADALPSTKKLRGGGSIPQYDDKGKCTGYTMVYGPESESQSFFVPADLYLQLSGTNTGHVSGSVKTNTPFAVTPKSETYSWDFRRTKKQQ